MDGGKTNREKKGRIRIGVMAIDFMIWERRWLSNSEGREDTVRFPLEVSSWRQMVEGVTYNEPILPNHERSIVICKRLVAE